MSEASNSIPSASISPPEGPWQQIPGRVAAVKGFKAAWMDCEPKERNLILHLLHATASDEVMNQELGKRGAARSYQSSHLFFPSPARPRLRWQAVRSYQNEISPPNQQISTTNSACNVNMLRWEKERNQAYELDIMQLLAYLGWKTFPLVFKNIINTMLSNRPESLPSSSSFLL